MKKIIVSMVAVLAIVFGSGCSVTIDSRPVDTPTPSVSTYSQSDAFVEVVREEIPALNDVDETVIVESAENLCSVLRDASPLTASELISLSSSFADGTGFMTSDEGAFFLGAASAAFCPEITEEIQDLTPGYTI